MMILTVAWLVLLCAIWASAAQPAGAGAADELVLVPIYDGPESTALSIYGTSPESPDGQRICYVRYRELSGRDWQSRADAELWVCDRDLTNHRKLFAVNVHNHNGANAMWIDNARVAFESASGIHVLNVDTGEVVRGPIAGHIGNDAHDHKMLFAPGGGAGTNSAVSERGIYELDCDTGKIRQIISSAKIAEFLTEKLGEEYTPRIGLAHLQFSPDGRRISFRLGRRRVATVRSDGTGLTIFPGEKPMHFLWYDSNTFMGADFGVRDGKPNNHEYRRWTPDGRFTETLAGPITHGAASPDRQWYAGESTSYDGKPIRLVLYRRGRTQPMATLMEHSFDYVTWQLRAHVNPSFSRDGKRVYFLQAVSNEKFRAVYVDMSRYIVEASREAGDDERGGGN